MNAQNQIEELTTGQTNYLIGALAWRMDTTGIVTRAQWDRDVAQAKEWS